MLHNNKKIKLRNKFNKTMIQFLDALHDVTDDSDFSSLKFYLENFLSIGNKDVPVMLFIKFIILEEGMNGQQKNDLAKKIKNRNEEYFLKINDGVIEETNDKLNGNKQTLLKIFKLRNVYKKLSEKNREILWDYLNLFLTYANKFLNF